MQLYTTDMAVIVYCHQLLASNLNSKPGEKSINAGSVLTDLALEKVQMLRVRSTTM